MLYHAINYITDARSFVPVAFFAIVVLLLRIARDVRYVAGPYGRSRRPLSKRCSVTTAAMWRCEPADIKRGQRITGKATPCFLCDSLFLAMAWQYLCSHSTNEVFHYVGGTEVSRGQYLLSHVVPVGHAHQSSSGARADAVSSIWALEQLDNWGLRICGHFHSHPGRGAEATRPSHIDHRFVKALAAGSYQAVGAIVSRDGFIRFYSDRSMPFTVEVTGNFVRKVDENVYQLDYGLAAGQLPVSIPRTLVTGGA